MADKKPHLGISYEPAQDGFMQNVQRTLVEQPDFQGIGGHETKPSSTHGTHSQVSIGIGGKTVDFRRRG